MRWLPQFRIEGAAFSDGRGPDAEGFALSVSWAGFIVEWHFYRRERSDIGHSAPLLWDDTQ